MPYAVLEGMHRCLPGTLGRDAANTILTEQDRCSTNLQSQFELATADKETGETIRKLRIEPAAGIRTAEAGMMGRLGNQVSPRWRQVSKGGLGSVDAERLIG